MLTLILLAISDTNNSEMSTLPDLVDTGLKKAKIDAQAELGADLTAAFVDSHNDLIKQAATSRGYILQHRKAIEEEEAALARLDRILAYAEQSTPNVGQFIMNIAPMVGQFGGTASSQLRIAVREAQIAAKVPEDFVVLPNFKGSARRLPLAVPKARS